MRMLYQLCEFYVGVASRLVERSTSTMELGQHFPVWFSHILLKIFFNIFYWLCYYSCPSFSPLYSPSPCTTLPQYSHPLSSCLWVVCISSLASPFPTLFLTSPYLFSTYHLCYLFSVPFSPLSSSHFPTDNPPCDLYFCESVPVLVVCLIHFCFCFSFYRFSCW